MKKIRITGIVKLANCVRQELAGPVSEDRLLQVQDNVGRSLQAINRLLAEAGGSICALPAPSQKAYQFLEGVNFKSITTQESAASNGLAPGSVSFSGLRSHLDTILDDLSSGLNQSKLRQIQKSIRESSENIER